MNKEKYKKMEQCQYFKTCNAPLCPLIMDIQGYNDLVWHPDEAICKRRDFAKLQWIISQKKIKKNKSKLPIDSIFTIEMLDKKYISGIGDKRTKRKIPKGKTGEVIIDDSVVKVEKQEGKKVSDFLKSFIT